MKYILNIGMIFPLAYMTALYTYVLRARLALGYFPTYGRPDPKDLGYCYHHELIYLLIFPAVLALVPATLLFIVLCFAVAFGWDRVRTAHVIVYGLVWGTFLTLSRFDPGDFLNWFLD